MLSLGAMSAVIVGTPDLDGADYRKKGLGAKFLEPCDMTAPTRYGQVICIRWFELQQVRQHSGSGMKQSGTNRRLVTLQIQSDGRLAISENDAKQLLYFAGDFLEDRFRRFFSCADGAACSTGRKRQIFRLTPTRSSVRRWNYGTRRSHSPLYGWQQGMEGLA